MRLIILFICFIGIKNTWAVTFEEANAMLKKGDTSAAVLAYEELITKGEKNSALYANLGHAYQEQGKIAAAALNYHRALMLNPRQIETRRALSELQKKSGITALPPYWAQVFVEKIPSLIFLIIGELFFWGGIFLLAAYLFRAPYKILSFLWRFGLLLIGASLLAVGWLGDPRVANTHLAVITAERGEAALSQPVETAQQVAFLPPGTAVKVLSERENWDYCQLPRGENSWISSSSLSFVNPDHMPDRS